MFKHFRDVIAFLALSQCGIRNVHAFELKQAQDQALICVYTNAARLVPQDYARVFAVKFSCPTVNNLDPLYGSDQLCSSALDHSMKMARFNCFRHDTCGPCTSKCTFIDRIRSVLPSASGYAENIASGFDSAFTFVNSWIESASHCKNIFGKFNRLCGATFNDKATQDFAQLIDNSNTGPIVCGAHQTDPEDGSRVTFIATVDQVPLYASVHVIVNGVAFPLQPVVGTNQRGLLEAKVNHLLYGCTNYYFEVRNGGTVGQRYPETESMLVGERSDCAMQMAFKEAKRDQIYAPTSSKFISTQFASVVETICEDSTTLSTIAATPSPQFASIWDTTIYEETPILSTVKSTTSQEFASETCTETLSESINFASETFLVEFQLTSSTDVWASSTTASSETSLPCETAASTGSSYKSEQFTWDKYDESTVIVTVTTTVFDSSSSWPVYATPTALPLTDFARIMSEMIYEAPSNSQAFSQNVPVTTVASDETHAKSCTTDTLQSWYVTSFMTEYTRVSPAWNEFMLSSTECTSTLTPEPQPSFDWTRSFWSTTQAQNSWDTTAPTVFTSTCHQPYFAAHTTSIAPSSYIQNITSSQSFHSSRQFSVRPTSSCASSSAEAEAAAFATSLESPTLSFFGEGTLVQSLSDGSSHVTTGTASQTVEPDYAQSGMGFADTEGNLDGNAMIGVWVFVALGSAAVLAVLVYLVIRCRRHSKPNAIDIGSSPRV